MAEDKLGDYTNVVKKRPFWSAWIGETTNNKASRNTVQKQDLQEEIKSLEGIEEEAKTHEVKTMIRNISPVGMAYNVGSELKRSYNEGDLTNDNILEKSMIALNPRLAGNERANDLLNQEVGSMVNEVRDTSKVLRDLQTTNPKLVNYANIEWENNVKSNDPFMEFALKNKIANIEGDVVKIDGSRISEMDKLQSQMSLKDQEKFSIWKASYGEERRLRDGMKRTAINPNLSPDDPLNFRAVAESPVVTDLNDRDRAFLNDDWEKGADNHKSIADNNREKYKEPDNFVYDDGKAVSFKKIDDKTEEEIWNKTDDGVGIEQFGDGKENPLGLSATRASSGVGIALNGIAVWLQEWWIAIAGIVILLGVLGYWLYIENQKKTKKAQNTKTKKSSTKKRRKKRKSRKGKKSPDSKPNSPINLTVNVNDYETSSLNEKTLVKEVIESGN
ncbi:MAG: hypothetical protein PF569_07990 [Candidatus Woesearchaeota archaeon]|jgi:uncharacterized short protein YbdD (DUF466 family)|nr:hypothetical protein [Candidatus Woesearchaeota archaeon]